MKKNLSKWKRYTIFINGRHIKIAILFIDRFNIIPTKNPVSVFAEIDKLILKLGMRIHGTQNIQTNSKKKTVEDLHPAILKLTTKLF